MMAGTVDQQAKEARMSSYDTMKRKQHYVWRYYLSAWAIDDLVICKRLKKVYSANIRDVAQQRDFYKIQQLGDKEVVLLHALIERISAPDEIKDLQRNIIQLFLMPHNGKTFIEKTAQMIAATEESRSVVTKGLDTIINNLEEDLHSAVEGGSISFIDDLRAESLAFWEEPTKRLDFLHFISLQMLRTKRMQEIIGKMTAEKMPEHSESLMKIWNPMRHILAINIASNLHQQNYGITLLINDTTTKFITSDQPVLNIWGTGLPKFSIPEKFEIYYPVSPTKGVLIGRRQTPGDCDISIITADKVDMYNRHIDCHHHEQLFSRTQNDLDRLLCPE